MQGDRRRMPGRVTPPFPIRGGGGLAAMVALLVAGEALGRPGGSGHRPRRSEPGGLYSRALSGLSLGSIFLLYNLSESPEPYIHAVVSV